MFIDFRESKGERDRQTDIDVREKHQSVASHIPQLEPRYMPFLGVKPTTFLV